MLSDTDAELEFELAPSLIHQSQLFLTLPAFSVQEDAHHDLSYPPRANRYFPYGVNYQSQACYSEEDIELMKRVQVAFEPLLDKSRLSYYFDMHVQKRFKDWWTCTIPNYTLVGLHWGPESFTLPSREAKDSKTFPLWNFADNAARRIANWQGERVKNQKISLMNDPVMLVFEELRDWFFNVLSERECRRDDLELIARRQSYLKDMMYLTPNFGPDRLNLKEIQHTLEEASKIVLSCIANKELPQLLSEIVVTGKNLETAIATYLHFLMIDEQVTDNFSSDFLEGKGRSCDQSPVCKIYRNLQTLTDYSPADDRVSKFLASNRFFKFSILSELDGVIKMQLQLKNAVLSNIRFASFIGHNDKEQYLLALASLEALINVRKTLESFQTIQPRIGTYVFAVNYLEKTNLLASNYISLIAKTKNIMQGLIKSADNSLHLHLMGASPYKDKTVDHYFERNLRALETKVAKGTTVTAQLDVYSANAVRSMNDYQIEMRKLAANYYSGKASIEVEFAMKELYGRMDSLNIVLPRLLDNQHVMIPAQLSITDGLHEPAVGQAVTMSDQVKRYEVATQYPFDSGAWDHVIRADKETNKPIFTYRVYRNNIEVGSADFYGQPLLCTSNDKRRHNIIKLTGVLSNYKLSDEATIEEICSALPPTMFDKVYLSAMNAAKHGAIRGGAKVVGVSLQSYGVSPRIAAYISQLAYVSALFTWNFSSYYEQIQEREESVRVLNAVYCAAVETGKVVVMNAALNFVSGLIKKLGETLEKNKWTRLGNCVKKTASYLPFSLFAYHAVERGVAPTAASLVSGATVEEIIDKSSCYMLRAGAK